MARLPFAEVVALSDALRTTRSRKVKIARLGGLLAALDRADAAVVVSWMAGELPQGRIGVGYAAVQDVQETPPAQTASLTVPEVHHTLRAIGAISGKGANARRREALAGLLGQATAKEQRFLVGLLLGELRQGAQEGIVAEAVAQASGVPAPAIRRAWMVSGSLPEVGQAALCRGAEAVAAFRPVVFRPMQPMLASSSEDTDDALQKLGEAVLEDKLDGARIQVHRQGDQVRVYTRQLRDVTKAVPEVVEAVAALPVGEVILDGEALAFHPDGRPHPFQVTMRRFGRKLNVAEGRRTLPLTPLFFDCWTPPCRRASRRSSGSARAMGRSRGRRLARCDAW